MKKGVQLSHGEYCRSNAVIYFSYIHRLNQNVIVNSIRNNNNNNNNNNNRQFGTVDQKRKLVINIRNFNSCKNVFLPTLKLQYRLISSGTYTSYVFDVVNFVNRYWQQEILFLSIYCVNKYMHAVSRDFENGTSSCISANALLRMVHILLSFIEKQVIRIFLFNHFIRSYFFFFCQKGTRKCYLLFMPLFLQPILKLFPRPKRQ